jgi:YD repeat-containing protein
MCPPMGPLPSRKPSATEPLSSHPKRREVSAQLSQPGFAQDAAANTTQDLSDLPTRTYQWDAEGRLVSRVAHTPTCRGVR